MISPSLPPFFVVESPFLRIFCSFGMTLLLPASLSRSGSRSVFLRFYFPGTVFSHPLLSCIGSGLFLETVIPFHQVSLLFPFPFPLSVLHSPLNWRSPFGKLETFDFPLFSLPVWTSKGAVCSGFAFTTEAPLIKKTSLGSPPLPEFSAESFSLGNPRIPDSYDRLFVPSGDLHRRFPIPSRRLLCNCRLDFFFFHKPTRT